MTSVLIDPAIEQVTQADRLPRQDLATVLAHELRNPLAPIAAAAEILLRQSPNEQVRQLGCIIKRNADQLRRLIDDLVQTTSASASPLSFFSPPLDPPEADAQCFVQHVLPFEADGRAMSSQVQASRDDLRILVVDDNRDAARLLGLFLQSLGHCVRVMIEPLAAIELASSFEPQVALLDIGLPGIDGHELARRLRRLPGIPGLRLAAVTAYSQSHDRQAAVTAGFEQYFVKPLDVQALQSWLEQVSRDLPPSVSRFAGLPTA